VVDKKYNLKVVYTLSFLDAIKTRARAAGKTVVLPEAGDARTLSAAHIILEEQLANVILIGDEQDIKTRAEGLNLSNATIINPKTYEKIGELSNTLYELRKAKGLTLEQATKLLEEDELFLGVMLVKIGIADGMVAGAANSTANVLRPSLQILKTAPGAKTVSSFFIMIVPDCDYGQDGVFVFSDCGLMQNPSAEELAAIGLSSAQSFENIVQAEPIVAFLSHSSKGSAVHADVDKVVKALEIAKAQAPSIAMDGEFQLDAAIVPEIGQSKAPGSTVAGRANVLVFPDLDAGNIGYKLVQRLAKAEAYGPICQGIAKPVNDLSRGCSVEDIVGVAAITAVQAI